MLFAAAMAIGSIVALLIVLSFAGKLQPVKVPVKYKAIYARQATLNDYQA